MKLIVPIQLKSQVKVLLSLSKTNLRSVLSVISGYNFTPTHR